MVLRWPMWFCVVLVAHKYVHWPILPRQPSRWKPIQVRKSWFRAALWDFVWFCVFLVAYNYVHRPILPRLLLVWILKKTRKSWFRAEPCDFVFFWLPTTMSTGQFCSNNFSFGTKEKHANHGFAQTHTISCLFGCPKKCTLANSAQTTFPLEPKKNTKIMDLRRTMRFCVFLAANNYVHRPILLRQMLLWNQRKTRKSWFCADPYEFVFFWLPKNMYTGQFCSKNFSFGTK